MAALTAISNQSEDVLLLKFGNVPPKSKVVVLVEFLQPLEVSLNTFWRLSVQSHVWPRYLTSGVQPASQHPPDFRWTFKV